LYLWAFLISFAQVYVGVHFPLDVIGGAILGVLLMKMYYLVIKSTVDRLIEEAELSPAH
jgi:membrane-associated phospholipid phosphatase